MNANRSDYSLAAGHVRHRSAFTLVEILVAITVLSILLIMLAQMLGLAGGMWKLGIARADNFTQTRVVLGMINRDVQSMVIRQDLASFVDDLGTTSCAFYTRFPSPSGNRSLSLVQYKIVTLASGPQLQRFDSAGAFSYPVANATTSTISLGNLTQLPGLANANSQPLVDGVVGFHIQFLGSDGQIYTSYTPTYVNADAPGNTSTQVPSKAVILSILVLDSAAYDLAVKTSSMNTLTSAVAGTPSIGETYAQYWNAVTSAPGFGTSLPKPIRAGIRVFERRISIPVPGAQ